MDADTHALLKLEEAETKQLVRNQDGTYQYVSNPDAAEAIVRLDRIVELLEEIVFKKGGLK